MSESCGVSGGVGEAGGDAIDEDGPDMKMLFSAFLGVNAERTRWKLRFNLLKNGIDVVQKGELLCNTLIEIYFFMYERLNLSDFVKKIVVVAVLILGVIELFRQNSLTNLSFWLAETVNYLLSKFFNFLHF